MIRPAPQPLVLASRNAHKRRELERMLGGSVALDPLAAVVVLPPESGETFAANALLKARTAARATGRAALADDSGIEAEALGGLPGVHSARFAGPDATDEQNLARLRREVPPGTALRYVCVIARVTPEGEEQVFEGTCRGTMAEEARGDEGFGYDPIFEVEVEVEVEVEGEVDATRRTMAQLRPDEKDAISHRGRAARALVAWLRLSAS